MLGIGRRAKNATGVRTTHPAVIASAAVHYIITADSGGSLDLARAVRKLLARDVAISAAWPSDGTILVPKRLRRIARSLKSLTSMQTRYERADESGKWTDALRLMLHHPRLGVLFVRSKLVQRAVPDLHRLQRSRSVGDLLGFIARHPWLGLRILPSIRFTRGKPEQKEEVRDSGLDIQDDFRMPDPADAWDKIAEIHDLVIGSQLISAVERQMDSLLFGGPAHDERRFVRLQLRGSTHSMAVPNFASPVDIVLEPRLFLHRSGIVQLSVRVGSDEPLTAQELKSLLWSPEPRVRTSEMSTPLFERTAWADHVTEMTGDFDARKPVARLSHHPAASISELLHIHLTAVLATLHRKAGDWMIYPVGIAAAGDCCPAEAWPQNHEADIRRLLMRVDEDYEVATHVPAPKDLSLRASHSFFADLGSALYIQWKGPRPDGLPELDSLLVVEYSQQLYMRLHSLEESVSSLAVSERLMRRHYAAATELFSELRQGTLRAGESRQVVNHLLDVLGAYRMRSTIETALNLGGMAQASISAARAARRSWWITLLATVLATLVAIPQLRSLLDEVTTVSPDDSQAWLVAPLRWAASLGYWGPWALVAGTAVVALVPMLFGLAIRGLPRRIPQLRQAYAWPTPVKVRRGPAKGQVETSHEEREV